MEANPDSEFDRNKRCDRPGQETDLAPALIKLCCFTNPLIGVSPLAAAVHAVPPSTGGIPPATGQCMLGRCAQNLPVAHPHGITPPRNGKAASR